MKNEKIRNIAINCTRRSWKDNTCRLPFKTKPYI